MVALRKFQDLIRMLACQSHAAAVSSSPSNRGMMHNKSTQTPDQQRFSSKNSRTIISLPSNNNSSYRQNLSPPSRSNENREHHRLSHQVQRKNNNCSSNNQYRNYITSDELSRKRYAIINSSLISNHAKSDFVNGNVKENNTNKSRLTSPAVSYRNNYTHTYNNDINFEKSSIKKKACDTNFVRNSDRVMNVLSKNHTVKTPPTKDHKFSRYTPLPAINQSDNLMPNTSPESRNQNYRLARQLTYKVMKPVFVKGPTDFPVNLNKLPMHNSLKKPGRYSTQMSHTIKRSKTIVIKKNKSVMTVQNKISDNDNNSNNKNIKLLGYPNTSVKNYSRAPERIVSKTWLLNRGKSFTVEKKFIEAAGKIKDGEQIVDNAFWVQF